MADDRGCSGYNEYKPRRFEAGPHAGRGLERTSRSLWYSRRQGGRKPPISHPFMHWGLEKRSRRPVKAFRHARSTREPVIAGAAIRNVT